MGYYFFHSLVVATLHSKASGVEGLHNPFLYRIIHVYGYVCLKKIISMEDVYKNINTKIKIICVITFKNLPVLRLVSTAVARAGIFHTSVKFSSQLFLGTSKVGSSLSFFFFCNCSAWS